jgi:hypothetical protein
MSVVRAARAASTRAHRSASPANRASFLRVRIRLTTPSTCLIPLLFLLGCGTREGGSDGGCGGNAGVDAGRIGFLPCTGSVSGDISAPVKGCEIDITDEQGVPDTLFGFQVDTSVMGSLEPPTSASILIKPAVGTYTSADAKGSVMVRQGDKYVGENIGQAGYDGTFTLTISCIQLATDDGRGGRQYFGHGSLSATMTGQDSSKSPGDITATLDLMF